MKLIWHGHSCFSVETGLYTVVFDPYADGSVPGCGPLRLTADAVYCSHAHHDHGARELVTLTGRACPVRVETYESFHDDRLGVLRGRNTIHVLEAEGMRVAHLGDLGHRLKGRTLEALRGLDAVLIPVGGYFTIDAKTAKQVVDDLQPRVAIPMHYRHGRCGYDVIGEVTEFTALFDNVVEYEGDRLELTAETPAQVAVLRYAHG